jgi:predicted ribosomally synthesized peptide with nif11-like leader
VKSEDAMPKKDAKSFLEKLEKDSALRLQISNARNEGETLKIIREQHFLFDQKEFQSAFEEKYHRPLKREELHKMAAEGWLSPELAAKMPFAANHPHHGD